MNTRAFELWDVETGNAVDAFATEAEALDAVYESLVAWGPNEVRVWALVYSTPDVISRVAQGDVLIKRALRHHMLAGESEPSASRQ